MRRIRLLLSEGTLAVMSPDRSGFRAAPCAEPAAVQPAFAAVLAANPLPRGVTVQVMLGPPHVQTRTLPALPPVGGRRLERLVAATPERFFRRAQAPLVTAARRVRARDGSSTIARAAAAEVCWIDAIEAALETGGWRWDPVGVLGEDDSMRLRGARAAARTQRRERRLAFAGLTFAAVVWIAAAGVESARIRQDAASLSDSISRLAPAVKAVREARLELEAMQAATRGLAASRQNHAAMLSRLALSLAAVPDSAFVTSLDLGRDDLTLRGFAARPSELAQAFESGWGSDAVGLEAELRPFGGTAEQWVPFTVRLAGPGR